MKELVVISGKGGTGKTTIVAAFAALAESKVVADCDVDAPDLHIILDPTIISRARFHGGKLASINKELCTECGRCRELCRFGAIDEDYVIDKVDCEGCGVCHHFCPAGAIEFNERISGEWFISQTRFGPMVHAQLGVAEENSGKLVTLVRQNARMLAEEERKELIIVDGAPGIGCPVISSIAGSDLVLIVCEPSLSGIHDMRRAAELAAHFAIPAAVCINKCDINNDVSESIKSYSLENNLQLVGEIPFDTSVIEAMVQRKSIVERSRGSVTHEIENMWQKTMRLLYCL
ncbi:MAG: ATP-binding protein [Acidobacteriota bacterium]